MPASPIRIPYQILFWICVAAFLFGFIWLFKAILLPFVLAAIIAYLLDPAVRKMRVRNIPRWVASLLILGSFVLFVVALTVLLAPVAYRELLQLVEMLPTYIDRLWAVVEPYSKWIRQNLRQNGLPDLQAALEANAGKALTVSTTLVSGLATGGQALLTFLYIAVLTPIIAFLMMKEWPKMKHWLDDMVPRQSHDTVSDLWHQIDHKLAGFIRGQLIVSFFLGMFYSIGLTIAGLKFGFLIGLMTGILSLIPIVGSTIGLLASTSVAWFQSDGDLTYTGIIAAIFFFGQFIEGNFLSPKLLGDSVGLHPLWIMFALAAGGALFGIVGMLIAVPVAAIVSVLVGFAIRRYKQSAVYNTPVVPPPLPNPPDMPA